MILEAVIVAAAVVVHGCLVGHTPTAETVREKVVERVIRLRSGRLDEPESPDTPIGL